MKMQRTASTRIWGEFLRWSINASICWVLGCSPILGTSQNPNSSQTKRSGTRSAVTQARASLARGNAEDAIRILTSYLQAHPRDTSGRVTLGQAYAMAGATEHATVEFQRVLEASPQNYVALAALGEIYYRAGELEKAESFLARAVKFRRGEPQLRLEWAIALARLHRYKEAQGALVDLPAPKEREEKLTLHRLRASVEMGLGNTSAAAQEMEKALELKPDDEQLNAATATAELQTGNWQRAAALAKPIFSRSSDPGMGIVLLEAELGAGEDYRQTLEQLRATSLSGEDEADFRQRLAELLVAHGKTEESIEDFRKASELEPDRSDLLFNLALAQYRAGKLEDALATAEKCKATADSAEVEDLLGDIQEARGDNLAAVRSYQVAVALAPKEEKYRLSLAVEFLRHKSFDAAKVVLQQAEETNPSSWRVQLGLGLVEHFAGTDEEASRIFLRAANLAPSVETVLRYLGDIQMDQAPAPDPAALAKICQYADEHPGEGKMQYYCGGLIFRRDYASGDKAHGEEILRRLQTASRMLAKDPSPHCQLEKVYRWLNRWPEALRESETCVRLAPDFAEGHYRLAQIYQHLGQQEASQRETKLYEEAAKRVADENARRDETIKTFLYTIQKEAPDRK